MSTQTQVPSANQVQNLVKTYTNAIFCGIQMLGFDFQAHEKQHKLTFNAQLFAKPNSKAFEIIVHFLLCQLDTDRAQKLFSQCWPAIQGWQQKEFKDAIVGWLSELSQPSKSSTSGKQQQHASNSSGGQHLLNLIRFPLVTKSLLSNPVGFKICELLFALTTYVLLSRGIKLADYNKSIICIFPKVSPFYPSSSSTTNESGNKQPFNQMQPSIATNTMPTTLSNAQSVKLMSQKHLNQFEIQSNVLRLRIEDELSNFNKLIAKILNVKQKWQRYINEKLISIMTLTEKKAQKTKLLGRKRQILQSCLTDAMNQNPNQIQIESFYSQCKDSKTAELFESNYVQFQDTINKTFGKETLKTNIDEAIYGRENKYELDGTEFVRWLSSYDTKNESNRESNDSSNKILKSIYENLDLSSTKFLNSFSGELLQQNRTQLDLIFLARLNKLLLNQKITSFNKINTDQFMSMINYLCTGSINDSNSAILLDSIEQTFSLNSFTAKKSMNEDSIKLKKKLEMILPKLKGNCDELVKKGLRDLKNPDNGDDIPSNEAIEKAKALLEEIRNLNSQSMNLKLLAELRELNRENEKNNDIDSTQSPSRQLNLDDDCKNDASLVVNNVKLLSLNRSLSSSDKNSSSSPLGAYNFVKSSIDENNFELNENDNEEEEEQSLKLLELDDSESNWDLLI